MAASISKTSPLLGFQSLPCPIFFLSHLITYQIISLLFLKNGCTHGIWKFPSQGLNLSCSCSCSNAGSLRLETEPEPLQWPKLLQSDSECTVPQWELPPCLFDIPLMLVSADFHFCLACFQERISFVPEGSGPSDLLVSPRSFSSPRLCLKL